MLPITYEINTSTLDLTDAGLTIHISSAFWSKKQWGFLLHLIMGQLSSGLNWLTAPISGGNMTSERGNGRWKILKLDCLSILIFIFMIKRTHLLRQLFSVIDWQKIDERCQSTYHNKERGAPAYAPQVLFRILLLMFSSGTPFESATLLRLETDVAWRWFAGLSILVTVPTAATLSYFRKRVGVDIFEAILIDLIQRCDEMGLIGHDESYYDMTGVEASATQATPYQRAVILAKAISTYLDSEQGGVASITEEEIAQIALDTLQEKHKSLEKVDPLEIVSSQKQMEKQYFEKKQSPPNWWKSLSQKIAQLPIKLSETTKNLKAKLIQVAGDLIPMLPQAFGNPDATVGHTRTDGTICGYRSGFLVDAKHFIIIAVIFVTLAKAEAPTLITALEKYYDLFGKYPKQIGLDSAFDRDEVHAYTEEKGIYASTTVRARPGAPGVYHADAFVWNDQQELICPNGEKMEIGGGPYKNGTVRYQAPIDCTQCRFIEQCMTEKQRGKEIVQRQLVTNTDAHQRAQRNRERSSSTEGRAIRRRRFSSEGLFGHLNHFHNGDKAPYRNQEMDNIAQIIVAFVSNAEKLTKKIHPQT